MGGGECVRDPEFPWFACLVWVFVRIHENWTKERKEGSGRVVVATLRTNRLSTSPPH